MKASRKLIVLNAKALLVILLVYVAILVAATVAMLSGHFAVVSPAICLLAMWGAAKAVRDLTATTRQGILRYQSATQINGVHKATRLLSDLNPGIFIPFALIMLVACCGGMVHLVGQHVSVH
jgi:uncharacterized membrane protein